MTIFLLIFFILMIGYGFLIDFYRRSWHAIPDIRVDTDPKVKVTVVAAVRNEEQNIGRLLSCLMAQDYPGHLLQIVLVDDHSTDGTAAAIRDFNRPDPVLQYLALGDEETGKKKALAAGIRMASGELILTTDADCEMSPRWVAAMASCYTSTGACFIAAPVMMKAERSFLGIFQMLDFLTLQGITGASVYRRVHAMCNGANLGYPKQMFTEVNGFEGIDHFASGDDMLLMQKIATLYPEKIFYLKSKDALVETPAEKTWKGFFLQRIRWASKAVHYRDRKIFYVLLLTYLVNTCFLITGIAAFIWPKWLVFLGLFMLAKIIIEFPFVNAVSIFFGRSALMMYFPLLEPFHIIYTVAAGWLGRFGSYTWKARVIKNN